MTRAGDSSAGLERHGFWIGAAVTALMAALYLATFCRTVFWYDSAEYATAAAVLGIPHPPGYPLYTLIGHVFTWLPLEPAAAVNLMSAVFGTCAVALAYAVVRRLGASPIGAATGALALGLGELFWFQAVIAEVYTPALAALLLVLLLVLRGLRTDRARPILAAAFVAGASMGLHFFIATTGLGLALLVASLGVQEGGLRAVFSRASLRRRLGVAAGALGAAFAGAALVFAYLPLRASMEPALNMGRPSTWERFVWVIKGGTYNDWFGGMSYTGRAAEIAGILYDQLTPAGLVLAAAGLVWLWRRAPVTALALTLMALGNLYFFFDYDVHDLEVFFLPTVLVLCLLAGLGVDAVADLLATRVRADRRRAINTIAGVALALYPLSLVALNYRAVDLSDFDDARDFGDRLVAGLPQGAVMVTFDSPPEWKANCVFEFYYQIVHQARPDVAILQPKRPAQILDALRKRGNVFVYYPIAPVVHGFVLEEIPELDLFRVVRPRTAEERERVGRELEEMGADVQ